MIDFEQVERAMSYARAAHAHTPRWDGSPYIYHLIRVANRVSRSFPNTETIVAAFLHDIVEDTPITLKTVYEMFGTTVAIYVDLLSQRKDESREDYFDRLFAGAPPEVMAIKFADRCDNMAGLHTCPDKPEHDGHIDRYFFEVENFFMPHVQRAPSDLALELMLITQEAKKLTGHA